VVYQPDTVSARPDFQILIYPVISMQPEITHTGSQNNLIGAKPSKGKRDYFSSDLNVTANTPPAFIVHAEDDKAVPVQNSINYFLALKNKNISAELHIYPVGGHGFGLAKNKNITASQWPLACITWLKNIEKER
jgi:acetyl esterase/lipase